MDRALINCGTTLGRPNIYVIRTGKLFEKIMTRKFPNVMETSLKNDKRKFLVVEKNMNELNAPVKKQRLSECVKGETQLYVTYKKYSLNIKENIH